MPRLSTSQTSRMLLVVASLSVALNIYFVVDFFHIYSYGGRIAVSHQGLIVRETPPAWTHNRKSQGRSDSHHDFGIKDKYGVSSKGHVILTAAVMSTPDNIDRRNVVRKTWKNGYENRTHFVKFVIGVKGLNTDVVASLENENTEQQDLLLLSDVQDGNLPYKVLATLVWFNRNVNYTYLLKTEDDCFAMLDRMEDDLRKRDPSHGLYWGYFSPNNHVEREGKWAEPNWKFCDCYFPYVHGGGYVLSADVIHRIVTNADGIILYNSEDVSVGSWTVSFDMERKHDVRFNTGPRGCKNTFLIFHHGEQYSNKSFSMDKLYRDTGKLCEREYITNEYEYDWNALPSKAMVHIV